MPTYDQIFSTVESYEGLTIQYLSFSKIGKVMRRIAQLSEIPRDDEFKFKERAMNLVTKWQGMVAPENGTSHPPEESHPNGTESGMDGEKTNVPKQEEKVMDEKFAINGTGETKVNGTAASSAEKAPGANGLDAEMTTEAANSAEPKKEAEIEIKQDSDDMDTSQS